MAVEKLPSASEVAAIVRRAILIGMTEGAQFFRNAMVQNLSGKVLKVRTNRGRSSVTVEVREVPDGVVLTGGSNVHYLGYWERGIRAHTIVPKRAKALKIPMAGAPGGFIFRKRAFIPAQAARPWLKPAAEEALPQIKERVELQLRRAEVAFLPSLRYTIGYRL